MIKNIENINLEIKFDKEKLVLPTEIQENIEKYWKQVIEENPNLWDGEIAYISKIIEQDSKIQIICKKTNFSHYIYCERVGLPSEYNCPNLSAGCLLETIDGYFIVGELGKTTSYPGMFQICGGNVDNVDILEDKIDIYKTISREVLEEVNIDLYNKEQVKKLTLKYMNIHKEFGTEIIAKGILNMKASEMKEYFDKYLKNLSNNNLEIEFEKLYFIEKENAYKILNEMENPKRNYLMPLIFEECKENNNT